MIPAGRSAPTGLPPRLGRPGLDSLFEPLPLPFQTQGVVRVPLLETLLPGLESLLKPLLLPFLPLLQLLPQGASLLLGRATAFQVFQPPLLDPVEAPVDFGRLPVFALFETVELLRQGLIAAFDLPFHSFEALLRRRGRGLRRFGLGRFMAPRVVAGMGAIPVPAVIAAVARITIVAGITRVIGVPVITGITAITRIRGGIAFRIGIGRIVVAPAVVIGAARNGESETQRQKPPDRKRLEHGRITEGRGY